VVECCFITEELIGKEETVNNKGELVIVENRERRLNLEVGDETGFTTQLQCRWFASTSYCPGQVAEMLVLSNQSDLSRIARKRTYIFPVTWVSDYPFLRRDLLMSVAAYDDAYSSDDSVRQDQPRRRCTSKRKSRHRSGTHAGSAAKTHCNCSSLLAIFVSCGVDYLAGNFVFAAEKTTQFHSSIIAKFWAFFTCLGYQNPLYFRSGRPAKDWRQVGNQDTD